MKLYFPFSFGKTYNLDDLSSSVRFLLKSFFYSIVKEPAVQLSLSAFIDLFFTDLVGLDGLEPSTSRLSGARSSHLSYKPEFNS